jgi:hypothetical protein
MVEWFYGKEGQQYGPIDEVTLNARIATGEIASKDLVWTEGMDSWKPLQEVRDLASEGEGEQSPVSGNQPPGPPLSPYAPPAAGLEGAAYRPGPSMPVTNGLAIASMICGILSLILFCFCGGIWLGIPGVICGHLSLNQLNAPGNQQEGRGMAIAGLICGYLGIAFFVIMILGGNISSYRGI